MIIFPSRQDWWKRTRIIVQGECHHLSIHRIIRLNCFEKKSFFLSTLIFVIKYLCAVSIEKVVLREFVIQTCFHRGKVLETRSGQWLTLLQWLKPIIIWCSTTILKNQQSTIHAMIFVISDDYLPKFLLAFKLGQ